jgi:hypothetical protein
MMLAPDHLEWLLIRCPLRDDVLASTRPTKEPSRGRRQQIGGDSIAGGRQHGSIALARTREDHLPGARMVH